MRRKERVNHRYVVNYEPMREGIEEGIQGGVHGEFETAEEAQDGAASCDRWFNQPTVLEPAEDAETGRTVMVKRKHRRKAVRIWTDHYINGELVEESDEPCEEESAEKGQKRNTSSIKEVLPVG